MKIFSASSMLNATFLVLILSVIFLSSAHASTKTWPLIAKGEVRYLKMIKVYNVGLYSPNTVTTENILQPNISKCLKLDYHVNLSVDKFKLATSKILQQQYTPQYLAKIKKPLDTLQQAYKPVKKGDSYTLCYNAKSQTMQLDINDKKLIEIKSIDLAEAYLGIWLSKNKPISTPLYQALFQTKNNTQ